MRQICTHCLKSVEVPESAAGGEFDCPACGEPFPVPKTYAPEVYGLSTLPPPPPPHPVTVPGAAWTEPAAPPRPDRPPPPPGLIPPSELPKTMSDSGPSGELRTRALPLAPGVLAWVAPACLTLALVLTFFPWVGAYPGGYRVFSQNPWRASIGRIDATSTAVPELQDAESKFKTDLTPSNLLLLLYAVLLVLTVALTWLERVLPSQLDSAAVHRRVSWLPGVWPYLPSVMLGWSLLLLLLLLYQTWLGFGLETAVQKYAVALHDKDLKASETNAKKQVVEIEVGMDAAKFAVEGTTAFDVAVLAHAVAVLALLGRQWLTRRGAKPHPRIAVQY
jgi:hypothetical protein